MKKQLFFKFLSIIISIFFSFISFIPCISGQQNNYFSSSKAIISNYIFELYNGSLSGYVNDSDMKPIEGARIKVSFHGTYEENYTDSSGFYLVSNIPMCWCMKNCTASKPGYSSEEVWLAINENTRYDFVLNILNNPPNRPIINGPNLGRFGQKINFTFKCTDPDGDDIKYNIKWGDGKSNSTSFFKSGKEITLSHTYHGIHSDEILFIITAEAEDTYGFIGPKETFEIKIARCRASDSVCFRLFTLTLLFQKIFNLIY